MKHAVVLALLGLVLPTLGCKPNMPASNQDAMKPVAVKAVVVAQQELRRTSTQPATVRAYFQADIRSKVPGYVRELKVDIGDSVETGAVLAIIDIPEMEFQRQVLEARIASYQAEEQRAESGIDLAEADYKSTEAKLVQAQSEMRRVDASVAAAEAEFARTQDLVQRQSLASRMLDEVRQKRDSELASKEAVTSAIQSAQAEVSVSHARRSAAQADLLAAQAQTRVAQRQLDELDVSIRYATIRAPFAGVITHRSVEPGDLVRTSSDAAALMVVSQVDRVRVHIPVPEADAPHVDRGDEVTLSFPSFSGEVPIVATVTRTAASLDPASRTLLVEVELENTEGKLLPGMFGQASIALSTTADAAMLPARAIRFEEGGQAFVYVVNAGDTISVTQVATGSDDGQSIQILSGVEPGQLVVDAHLQRFTTGEKVQLLKYPN